MISCFKMTRDDRADEKNFIKNGGIVLEELIALCNDRSNIPIPHFSANELMRATNNYDSSNIFLKDDGYELYKGSLKNRLIIVKKYVNDKLWGIRSPNIPYKDIVVGSQMSIHKNVLKVIGYCLKTQRPIIVYEFVGTKFLSECIFPSSDVEPLPWKCRLKIATDLANAIAYLHTAFTRPIIHRDINFETIILDENNVPKLFHFGLCIAIPEGQSHVEATIVGRKRSMAPEYWATRCLLTEKADVYSFGLLLLELFCGRKTRGFSCKYNLWNNCRIYGIEELKKVVDPTITREGIKVEQLLNFAKLINICVSKDEEMRLTMTDVGRKLRQIYQSFPSPC